MRYKSAELRENDYTLVNCSRKSSALSQTCSQVSDEINVYLPEPTFKFACVHALISLLSCYSNGENYERRMEVLRSASRVLVVVKKEGFYEDHLSLFAMA